MLVVFGRGFHKEVSTGTCAHDTDWQFPSIIVHIPLRCVLPKSSLSIPRLSESSLALIPLALEESFSKTPMLSAVRIAAF